MNNIKKRFILNIILFAFVLFATLWMMSGVTIAGTTSTLSAARWGMLKYFTVDSNILMGIIALWAAILDYQIIKGKRKELPNYCYVLYLMGTVGVTLTMLVTIFFLAPTSVGPWIALFSNSNFFLHLINPLVAIIIFVGLLRTKNISFVSTFIGIIPLILYAIYYVIVSVAHSANGRVLPGYDWYGFFVLGVKSGFVIVPLIVLITYGISVCLWKINKGKKINKDK